MSLQVNDLRIRGRSKSPSGRTRDRSKSASRVTSPAPTQKNDYDYSADEDPKYKHRESNQKASTYRESSSRYDFSDARADRPRRRSDRRDEDGYYLSDSGDNSYLNQKEPLRGTSSRPYELNRDTHDDSKDYARSHHRKSSKDDEYYSDDLYSDSDDENLAYGEAFESSRYKAPRSPRPSAPISSHPRTLDGNESSSRLYFRTSSPRVDNQQLPGNHPSYARPDRYQYADLSQIAQSQRSGYDKTPQLSYAGLSEASAPPIDWASVPECERPGFVPPQSQSRGQSMPGAFYPPEPNYPEVPDATTQTFATPHYTNLLPQQLPYGQRDYQIPIPNNPTTHVPQGHPEAHQLYPSATATSGPSYATPPQWQYAQVDPHIKYTSKNPVKEYTQSTKNQLVKPYTQSREVQFLEPKYESRGNDADRAPMVGRLTSLAESSAQNLTVAGSDVGWPPASPLLEPYKGTYQSISPMPSPIMVPSRIDDDVSDLEPLDLRSDTERRRKAKIKSPNDSKQSNSRRSKKDQPRSSKHERHESRSRDGGESITLISPSGGRKKVAFYNATEDAKALQEVLSHSRNIDPEPLIHILPHLTSDEVLILRKEYKSRAKVHGKGINIAKHIRLKLGSGSFGKVCYATALGRWESEAYWANCYYQSGTSRRELLIESLIGRTNAEIREIKCCFRDSRYSDSLEKCMKAELKADKFRTAILLALEEKRQSEHEPIDPDLIERDVQELHRALVSRDGGETAMIYIVMLRSNNHLRKMLLEYDKVYRQNFARAMIAKSKNLVGETLAHILNGAINRPLRDALLLNQALRESRTGKERSDLLISRLVRLHWEPRHLETVKAEFRKRYNERLEEAIAQEILGSSSGADWGEFCIELARSSSVLFGRE